jgi:nucleoside-diphosphate-sugar epimerase
MSTVLVTGGSGFLAGHCILQLLGAGHSVRTTVRQLAREPEVRATLVRAGADRAASLSFHAADLEQDAGWHEAAAGCDYVLHVASPFPPDVPKDEDDLIVPAREGSLRVLRAARDGGVRRVVLTSSFAAIGYGHPPQHAPFDESRWSNLAAPGVLPYIKSKTLAERAAWDFVRDAGGALTLSVVNPTAIFGPVLGPDFAASILLLQRLLVRGAPALPRLYFGVVDVRDVADLHLRAMTSPAAAGQRFIACGGDFMSLLEIARLLKTQLGDVARKVRARQIPDVLVRLIALLDPSKRHILPELGKIKNATSAKARRELGWSPRSREETLLATVESLQRHGLLVVD